MTTRRRKNTRLPSVEYQTPSNIFSITMSTHYRASIFRNSKFAKTITDTLHIGPFADNMKLYAYCLMPDHLHLLISPVNGDLSRLINRWKSYTANELRRNGLSSKCWQRGFYDHALRKEEDIKTTAKYIINNPVRAGIVDRWYDYEYSWHMWMQ